MSILDKKGLYCEIDYIRSRYNLIKYPIKMLDLCNELRISVAIMPFNTEGLRGMACKGATISEDIILLSSKRDCWEQNIDCGHEFVHLQIQRDEPISSFRCFEKVRPQQNKFLEWQANEGSAELLVPYKILLPKIKERFHLLTSSWDIMQFKDELAEQFCVSPIVIYYRFESLKYEIYQYLNGVSLNNLSILSKTAQDRQNIIVKSINDMQDQYYIDEFGDWCANDYLLA